MAGRGMLEVTVGWNGAASIRGEGQGTSLRLPNVGVLPLLREQGLLPLPVGALPAARQGDAHVQTLQRPIPEGGGGGVG